MKVSKNSLSRLELEQLRTNIELWAKELGFAEARVTDTDLNSDSQRLKAWLQAGYQGQMHYMQKNQALRGDPCSLHPNTLRIISVRMNYLPVAFNAVKVLKKSDQAYIARYALGRDYHKLMRKRLVSLADKIAGNIGPFGYRAFVDSAPVLERALAQKSGQGWFGKNTMLLNRKDGSWFFLGELFTDLPLFLDQPMEKSHCGSCRACLDICPTNAFVAPYKLDARKCISYLTIEYKGSIPIELRPLLGNRIFGCDDCQLICPWNRFAKTGLEKDFYPRHGLDDCKLVELFLWTEDQFLLNTQGSAIRRAGFERWLRNIAVALGNAQTFKPVIEALQTRQSYPSLLVQEHVSWALEQHKIKKSQ